MHDSFIVPVSHGYVDRPELCYKNTFFHLVMLYYASRWDMDAMFVFTAEVSADHLLP